MKQVPSTYHTESEATTIRPFEFHDEPVRSSSTVKADPWTQPLLRTILRVRYWFARPMQVTLLPSLVPVIPLPYLKHVPYITVGHVLLLLPWLFIFLASYHLSLGSDPSTDGSGKIAEYAIVAAFLTANKSNSIFHVLFGISYERLVPIHNLYACLALITSVFHLHVAYVYGDKDDDDDNEGGSQDDRQRRHLSSDDAESRYGLYGPDPQLWKFLWDGTTNFTGSMATACMVGLVLLSFFRVVRQYLYEPWLFSHIAFAMGTLLFGYLHDATLLVLPLVWWIMDGCLRYLWQARGQFPATATLTNCTNDVVKIQFTSFPPYQAGQYVRIAIPAVGMTEFSSHPISISSSPCDGSCATLHIKACGGWSQALVDRTNKKNDHPPPPHPQEEVSVLVDGPYGHLSMDLDQYSMIVCIAGGIGVTVSRPRCWYSCLSCTWCRRRCRPAGERVAHPMCVVDNDSFFVSCCGGGELFYLFGELGWTQPCQSIARQVLHESSKNGEGGRPCPLVQLRFVWVVRDLRLVQNYPTVVTDGSMATTTTSMTEETAMQDHEHVLDMDEGIPSSILNNNNKETIPKYIPQVYWTSKDPNPTALADTLNTAWPGLVQRSRPDLSHLVHQIVATAQEQRIGRVAVLTCGPPSLVDSVRHECRRSSSSTGLCGGVSLDVHHEVFSY